MRFNSDQIQKIGKEISSKVDGKTLFDEFSRGRYSTDANRGSELKKGQIVMTGSTFPTYFPQKGDRLEYEVLDVGKTKINIV